MTSSFRGPLAFSSSSGSNSNDSSGPAHHSVAYAVLTDTTLAFFEESTAALSPAATAVTSVELSDFTTVEASGIQQGLTWEILLTGQRAESLDASLAPERSSGSSGRRSPLPSFASPGAASSRRNKSISGGLAFPSATTSLTSSSHVGGRENAQPFLLQKEKKTSWLKAKLRSKSISASASANSLAALAASPPPPLPSSSATSSPATSTSSRASSRRLSATPLSPISTHALQNARSASPGSTAQSVLLSTSSRELQQRWIGAIRSALTSTSNPPSPATLSPSASLPSLRLSTGAGAYSFPRKPSTPTPSPLRDDSTEENETSFLDVGPPSPVVSLRERPRSSFPSTVATDLTPPKASGSISRRLSSPSVNPLLPAWLDTMQDQRVVASGSMRQSKSAMGLAALRVGPRSSDPSRLESASSSSSGLEMPNRGIKISIHAGEEPLNESPPRHYPATMGRKASPTRRQANSTSASDGSAHSKASTLSSSFLRPSPSSASIVSSASMFVSDSSFSSTTTTSTTTSLSLSASGPSSGSASSAEGPTTPVLPPALAFPAFLDSPPVLSTPKESPGSLAANRKWTSYFSSSPSSASTNSTARAGTPTGEKAEVLACGSPAGTSDATPRAAKSVRPPLHSRAISAFTSASSRSSAGTAKTGTSSSSTTSANTTPRSSADDAAATTDSGKATETGSSARAADIGRHIMDPAELRRRMEERTAAGGGPGFARHLSGGLGMRASSSSHSLSGLSMPRSGSSSNLLTQRMHIAASQNFSGPASAARFLEERPSTAPSAQAQSQQYKYTFGKAHPGQAPPLAGTPGTLRDARGRALPVPITEENGLSSPSATGSSSSSDFYMHSNASLGPAYPTPKLGSIERYPQRTPSPFADALATPAPPVVAINGQKLDREALFAALPPPKKRVPAFGGSSSGSGMKPSHSMSSFPLQAKSLSAPAK